jgi:hypothetical protein
MSATFSPVDPPRGRRRRRCSPLLLTGHPVGVVDWPPCRSTRATFAAALRQYAAGVCLLTVRDDIDDVGTTVSSVMSVSARPPLVAVGLAADGYPAEVLGRSAGAR